jgi:hypothetical protein
LLCREQGKPFQEASGELEHFDHGLHFYAGLASKVRGARSRYRLKTPMAWSFRNRLACVERSCPGISRLR